MQDIGDHLKSLAHHEPDDLLTVYRLLRYPGAALNPSYLSVPGTSTCCDCYWQSILWPRRIQPTSTGGKHNPIMAVGLCLLVLVTVFDTW